MRKTFVFLLMLILTLAVFSLKPAYANETAQKVTAQAPRLIQTPLIERTLRNVRREQMRQALRVGQKGPQGGPRVHTLEETCLALETGDVSINNLEGGGDPGFTTYCLFCFCFAPMHSSICLLPGSCYLHVGMPCYFIVV